MTLPFRCWILPSGLAWQEKPDPETDAASGTADRSAVKVADVAQEEVVEPKIEVPQPDEKPLGETLKDLFAKPVMPEMTDVHLPLNSLNIESFLRKRAATHHRRYRFRWCARCCLKSAVMTVLAKLILDIDANRKHGEKSSGTAQLANNWPVDITLNSTLNIDPG